MAFGCSQAQEIKNCIWTEIGQMRVKTGQRPAPSARTDTEQALESPLQAGKNRNGISYLMHRGIAHRSCVFAMALARPFWKGYLKLSLVSCPIAMFPASSRERVSFRQISSRTPATGSSSSLSTRRRAMLSSRRTRAAATRSAATNTFLRGTGAVSCARRSAHQQLACHLAAHGDHLVLGNPRLHEVGDKELQPVRRARVAGLAQIRRQHEILRSYLLDGGCGFLDLYLPPEAHPSEMRGRSHNRAHRAELEFRSHRRRLLHLLEAHVDDFELSMADDEAVNPHVAPGLDDGKRLGRREVAGVHDELLLGGDFENVAHRRKHLAVGGEHLDALGRILEAEGWLRRRSTPSFRPALSLRCSLHRPAFRLFWRLLPFTLPPAAAGFSAWIDRRGASTNRTAFSHPATA